MDVAWAQVDVAHGQGGKKTGVVVWILPHIVAHAGECPHCFNAQARAQGVFQSPRIVHSHRFLHRGVVVACGRRDLPPNCRILVVGGIRCFERGQHTHRKDGNENRGQNRRKRGHCAGRIAGRVARGEPCTEADAAHRPGGETQDERPTEHQSKLSDDGPGHDHRNSDGSGAAVDRMTERVDEHDHRTPADRRQCARHQHHKPDDRSTTARLWWPSRASKGCDDIQLGGGDRWCE